MSLIKWFTIARGVKLANWMMLQTVENSLYTVSTVPQIIALPGSITATAASYQIQSSGDTDRGCLSIIDFSGVIAATKNLGGTQNSLMANFIQNNGLDSVVHHGLADNSTKVSTAQFNSSTYSYGSKVYSDDGVNSWDMRFAKARSNRATVSFEGIGSNVVISYKAGVLTKMVPGFNTSTWRVISEIGQLDADSSDNIAFATSAVSSSGDSLLFGRITDASYSGYSFWASGIALATRPQVSVRADNSAIVAVNETASKFRLFEISSTPSMARHYTYTDGSGANLTVVSVSVDPDDSDAAFAICKTNNANQALLLKVVLSTGAISYKKVFTFSGAVSTLQMHVHQGCIYMAIRIAAGAVRPINFFAKLDKATITDGTYTIPGYPSSVGNVVVATFANTITPASQTLTGLSSISLTRTGVVTATPSISEGQQGRDFFNNATLTI